MNRSSSHRLTGYLATFAISLMTANAFGQQPPGVVVSEIQPGIVGIAADNGNWGGESMGTSHQNHDQYVTEKTLYVPQGALDGVEEARLRVFMAVLDNSSANAGGANGLDESFTITVNGKVHEIADDEPSLPIARWQWHDFKIPVSDLQVGNNTFVFKKTHSEKNDDYLYIGIANPTSYGLSRMSQDGGKTWSTTSLNAINAAGEYMVQLVLLKKSVRERALWSPGSKESSKLVGYAGIENDSSRPYLNLELDPFELDANQPMQVTLRVEGAGSAAPAVRWLSGNKALNVKTNWQDGVLTAEFPPSREPLTRLEVEANAGGVAPVKEIQFDYAPPIAAQKRRRVDMAPRLKTVVGTPVKRPARARLTADGFVLENATQIASFSVKPNLRLTSLHSEYLKRNVLAHPEATHLFLTEVGDKRYGAEDWKVEGVKSVSTTAIEVALSLPTQGLAAKLTLAIDAQELRFGLQITNTGRDTQTWKTAFPQIGGLKLAEDEQQDFFLFPIWGGAVASQNVNLRTYYGDESAWWQMMALFSPEDGGGLMFRSLDEKGFFKGVAMRKGAVPVDGGTFLRGLGLTGMAPDMAWQNSLDSAPGTAMDFEYVKYTRKPGESFSPPSAAVRMFAGDWHHAMQSYSEWAHRVWKWRPWPSKVRDRWNVISPGWQQQPLFKDGKWRTDYINDKADVAELMSWWTWSKKGPWQVPMDQIKEKLGENIYNTYSTYWVVNSATGNVEYPINRGDYDYNVDWGGLPALKRIIQKIRDGGQQPWFYTDPFLADDNTELGQKYGRKYGIMNPRYSDYMKVKLNPPGYVADYASWNMCLDTAWYQQFVADQMARVVKDTGIDGIRFDQFGLASYACTNPQHTHVFAEHEHNQGLQAQTLICEKVQEAVGKVKPDFVLTAEFSGYDRMAATLEGAINYESSRQTFEGFRPIPLNIFRFYFPEHKPFDLDDKGREHGQEWRFWNASGAFDSLHPPRYFRILKDNSDTFDTRQSMPLAPTLAEGIYANRFTGGGKTITLLYNAYGLTVNRPLMNLPAKAGFHYFDLLRGVEAKPEGGNLVAKIRPHEVMAIAQLPKVMTVGKSLQGVQIALARPVPKASIALCNAEGEELSRMSATGKSANVPFDKDGQGTYVKLYSGQYLIDAQAIPTS